MVVNYSYSKIVVRNTVTTVRNTVCTLHVYSDEIHNFPQLQRLNSLKEGKHNFLFFIFKKKKPISLICVNVHMQWWDKIQETTSLIVSYLDLLE